MKPWKTLATAGTKEGPFLLCERDGELAIRVRGKTLMSSRAYRSEEVLGEICARALAKRKSAKVLLGGLGMGFTLRALLDNLPIDSKILVAELLPQIVEWNKGPLAHLTKHSLSDPRVSLEQMDVGKIIARSKGAFDAILLDVDNGPEPLSRQSNRGLYGPEGLAAAKNALRPGGIFALWSAEPEPLFQKLLKKAGFQVEAHLAAAYGKAGGPIRGKQHVIYLGRLAG